VTLALRPASSFGLDELAGLFTAAYEGYVIPFVVDEPRLRFMVGAFDLDLDGSRVAVRDGEPVGLANLGVRGERGWIGGVGVVPAARRSGIARQLMEALHAQARRLGLREVWLEVIDANETAFSLYRSLGYEVARWVEVWSLEHDGPRGSAREVSLEQARGRIRELRRADEPWQRADGTLDRLAQLGPAPRGLLADGGAAVVRVADGRASLVQIAGRAEAARELIATARAHGPIAVLNLPEDDPAAAALRSLGGTVTIRQREMRLRL
jgi:GNAT superfamily N-acetyltransferase